MMMADVLFVRLIVCFVFCVFIYGNVIFFFSNNTNTVESNTIDMHM